MSINNKSQLSKIIQSVEILSDLIADIPQVMFQTKVDALKTAPQESGEKATEYYVDTRIYKLKNIRSSKGSGLVLTNNKEIIL